MRPILNIAAGLPALCIGLSAWAADVSDGQIHALLVANQCQQARSAVEAADNRQAFLSPPYGRMLYGGSVCCSPADTLGESDIDGAAAHLRGARGSLGPDSDAWIDSLLATCERTRDTVKAHTASERELLDRRQELFFVASSIIGKVLGRCQDRNVTPLAATQEGRETSMTWIVPSADGATQPPPGYIQALLSAHVGPNPETAVCAPFVAVSGSQDPARICAAAHRFLEFFGSAYGARRPLVWIGLHNYPADREFVYEHAQAAGEPIHCRGVLGYFDWQRQSVIWSAPPGFFGTFNHELAHALMFWDAPLLPRWFDEGVAALYENSTRTGGVYLGIENPWRQELLRRRGMLPVTRDMLNDVTRMAPLEFEADSRHSTVAREAIRHLQDCGKLAAVYTAMRAEARSRETLADAARPVYEPYPDARTAAWHEIIERESGAASCW